MVTGSKKISKSFIYMIVIILVIFVTVWFYWSNIEKLIVGDAYEPISSPVSGNIVDKTLKQKIIDELGKFRQYGEWPILINQENPDRGDPFTPKKQ